MPAALTLVAAAKINLSLHITGRRPNGYHDLESLIGFTDIADVLTFTPADNIHLSISGPESDAIECDARNLVVQAARLVQSHLGTSSGVDITLEKNIPVAAGLGGGSADAAATVSGCLALWGKPDSPPISDDVLAQELGADVPVCRYGRAAIMSGIGEHITPALNWPSAWLVLANPRVSLSTADVFRTFDGPLEPEGDNEFAGRDYPAFLDFLNGKKNSLNAPATALASSLVNVLDALSALPGCDLARMSGSGATCFGLFETREAAEKARESLSNKHPNWWIRSSALKVKTPS